MNNAGGYWSTRRTTVDGMEQTFALNHLAPFLLTNLLLEALKVLGPEAAALPVSLASEELTGRPDRTFGQWVQENADRF